MSEKKFLHHFADSCIENIWINISSQPNRILGSSVPVMRETFFRIDGIPVIVEVMATCFEDKGMPAVRVAFREIASP